MEQSRPLMPRAPVPAAPVHANGQRWEERTASSSAYTVYWADDAAVALTLTRPNPSDESVLLSVPGTYTSPQDRVEGYVVLDGEIIQQKERQGWNGAAIFDDGEVRIIATNRGQLLTKAFVAEVAAADQSLIQGHLLVAGGVAEHFKEQPLFIRRALVVFADGRAAVVESQSALDLNDFSLDLVELGVADALNLDMGSWSAGWYRDARTGLRQDIGILTDSTRRQSNWIIFRNK